MGITPRKTATEKQRSRLDAVAAPRTHAQVASLLPPGLVFGRRAPTKAYPWLTTTGPFYTEPGSHTRPRLTYHSPTEEHSNSSCGNRNRFANPRLVSTNTYDLPLATMLAVLRLLTTFRSQVRVPPRPGLPNPWLLHKRVVGRCSKQYAAGPLTQATSSTRTSRRTYASKRHLRNGASNETQHGQRQRGEPGT